MIPMVIAEEPGYPENNGKNIVGDLTTRKQKAKEVTINAKEKEAAKSKDLVQMESHIFGSYADDYNIQIEEQDQQNYASRSFNKILQSNSQSMAEKAFNSIFNLP